MSVLDSLFWMKNVNAGDGRIAYDDCLRGDVFNLHWPKSPKSNAAKPDIGDQIVISQRKKITHVVKVLGKVRTIKNATHPYVRKCEVLWASSNWNDYTSQEILGFTFKFGNGRAIEIENCKPFKRRWSAKGLQKFQNYVAKKIFRGRTVASRKRDFEPTTDPVVLDERVKRLRARGTLERPKGNPHPKSSLASIKSVIERLPDVKAWVLQEAKGICELCERPGPFLLPNGDRFLEVHHVEQLGHGGADTVENAVAVCPNCHRLLHCGAEAHTAKARLYKLVKRLTKP